MDPAWQLGVDPLSEEADEFCAKLGISMESQQATEPAKRKPPTAAKIAMLKGEGGLCFVKQTFAGHLLEASKHLLEALGYKVDILAARVTHPGNHVIILVHDVVERGDSFLVEVGSGYPSTAAVPITNGSFEHHFRESFRGISLHQNRRRILDSP